MVGLFFSQASLFAVAALAGFAVGWRLFVLGAQHRQERDAQEVEALRSALSEAQVRRARVA